MLIQIVFKKAMRQLDMIIYLIIVINYYLPLKYNSDIVLYLIKSYLLEIYIGIFTDKMIRLNLLQDNQVWLCMSGWGYK